MREMNVLAVILLAVTFLFFLFALTLFIWGGDPKSYLIGSIELGTGIVSLAGAIVSLQFGRKNRR